MRTEQSFDILSLSKNIFYGNGNNAALKQNSSLWFLPSLFTIELLYYFIIKYTRNNTKREIFTLIFILVLGFISSNVCKIILPFGINTAINIGIFFYIGYLLKERKVLDKCNVYIVTILGLLFGLFSCYYGNKIHLSYIDFYYGKYFYMILSGLFLSLFTLGVSKIICRNRILEYVGRNTMNILIFHKLFIIAFQTKMGIISNNLMNSNICMETLLAIIITTIAIVLSLIVSYPIKKFLPFLLGEKNEK